MNRKLPLRNALPLLLLGVSLLAGCNKGAAPPGGAGAAGAAPPPPSVQVAAVTKEDVNVYRNYTAEFKALQTNEIRTRVGGTLDSVQFAEGAMVQAGQVLFQIDPQPYLNDITAAEAALAKAQAGVSQAEGQVSQARGAVAQAQARLQKALTQVNFQESKAGLVSAEATLSAAEREVKRYKPLQEAGAVPGQQYDQAVDRRDVAKAQRDAVRAQLTNTTVNDQADVGVARADVVSAQANLETAIASVEAARADVQTARNNVDKGKLYLTYTTIKAPFTGFIGRLALDRGTMIVQGNAVLATISSVNPIYADFPISEPDYLQLKAGQGFSSSPFGLTLTNGDQYSEDGQFVLTENNVDAKTGSLVVRVRFNNPNYLLKPGGFGRVTMKNREEDNALVIPQKAIFSNQSLDSVYVLGADNTVEPRNVTLGDRVKENIVVTKGLKEGETIIVDGLQKVRPGIKVTPEKAGAAPKDGAPKPGTPQKAGDAGKSRAS